jgi:hypothetical protein
MGDAGLALCEKGEDAKPGHVADGLEKAGGALESRRAHQDASGLVALVIVGAAIRVCEVVSQVASIISTLEELCKCFFPPLSPDLRSGSLRPDIVFWQP